MWGNIIDFESGAFIANEAPALFGILPIYGIIALIGLSFSISWAYIEWNKNNYRTWDFFNLIIFTSLFALYGAKIAYLILDYQNAFSSIGDENKLLNILTLILIPSFGRTIIGSIIFVPIGIYIYKRIWGPDLDFIKMTDIILPAMFIGQAIGRWGNLVNHQIYGEIVTESSLNFLPNWMKEHMYIIDENGVVGFRSPIFFYESIGDILAFVLLIIIVKTNNYWKKGTSLSLYFLFYGIIRSSTELFRDPSFQMKWGNVPISFVIALIFIILGISLFLYFNIQKNKVIG